MTYYNIKRAFIRAVKVFFNSLVSKGLLLMIIIFLILLLFINDNFVYGASGDYEDIFQECVDIERKYQDEFVLFSYVPFINQTDSWKNNLSVVYDSMINSNTDIFCTAKTRSGNTVTYNVYLYYRDQNFTTNSTGTFTSSVDGNTTSMVIRNYSYATQYIFSHTINNNTISMSVNYPASISINLPQTGYKSPLLYEFLETVNGYNQTGNINYTNILNSISNYLDNINQNTDNIESKLDTIISVLNTIQQKNPTDYTSQISGINNQVNTLNSSIQTQTQQQHQDAQATQNAINNQTQQQHQDAQATQNTIQESTNEILSTDADEITLDDFGVSSPTIEGSPDLTNIFDLLYSSFMTVYEDDIYRIQFKLPSGDTTYNFDIPADALRDKLPDGLIVLISVFWWVVLGGAVISFIVKIIHQVVTYSNGSVDGSGGGGFLSELTMTPTEFVLFNILH